MDYCFLSNGTFLEMDKMENNVRNKFLLWLSVVWSLHSRTNDHYCKCHIIWSIMDRPFMALEQSKKEMATKCGIIWHKEMDKYVFNLKQCSVSTAHCKVFHVLICFHTFRAPFETVTLLSSVICYV